MDFQKFLKETSPEVLEKLAEDVQNEMVTKVAEALMPIFEKSAQYTAYLIKEALQDVAPTEAAPILGDEPIANPKATVAHNNEGVEGSNIEGGIDVNQVTDAIREALVANAANKIAPFVKAVASAHPEAYTELVKLVKVQLQDAVMHKILDTESAAAVVQELDNMTAQQ